MAKQLALISTRMQLKFRDVVLNPSPGHIPAAFYYNRDAKRRADLIANSTEVEKVAKAWRILVECGGAWYYFSNHDMLLSTSTLKGDV